MVKALVTGSTGFVGSHIIRLLNEAGHTVRALHRSSSRLDALAGLTYESALGDVMDEDALRSACDGCDWVFHVAAVADYWQADETHMMAVNVEGTRRVLKAAREAGVKRVVFTSSAAAIGIRRDGLPADENVPFALPPHKFPYGYSKVKAEEVVQYAVKEYGQDIVTVNPVVILGPGDLNMISGRFITEMARLQWTIPITSGAVGVADVRDIARWHILAAEKGRTGERYILGTANYSYADWYQLVAETVQVKAPIFPLPALALPVIAWGVDVLRGWGLQLPVDADQTRLGGKNIIFNYRKAWDELGTPTVEMPRSLHDTYHWYLEHGYIQKADKVADLLAAIGRYLPV